MRKMTRETLKAQIQEQYSSAKPTPVTLKDRLIAAYREKVLRTLMEIFSGHSNRKVTAEKLAAFLKENWENTQESAVCYTAIPTDPVTLLLCDTATWLAKQPSCSAISLLMPTVCTDHLTDPTKNLDRFDVKTIIKTHILSQCGNYLIPAQLLLKIPQSAEIASVEIFNPYYDVFTHEEKTKTIAASELLRLYDHSHETRALLQLRNHYFDLSSQGTNLLSQLRRLKHLMTANSAHGGTGTQTEASRGGFIAIVDFFEYFDRLSIAEKEKIPADVLEELDLIRSYGTPQYLTTETCKRPIFNPKNAEIGSCLGTRAMNLLRVIDNNESTLATILPSCETQEKLIATTMENYANAISAYNNTEFHAGTDPLLITKALCDHLNVPLEIKTFNDLDIIKALQPEEMNEVFKCSNLPSQIIAALENLENLIILISELSCIQTKTLLEHLIKSHDFFIKNFNDLLGILITLDFEKFSVVCDALEPLVKKLESSPPDLKMLLNEIQPRQREYFLSIFKETVKKYIVSIGVLTDLIRIKTLIESNHHHLIIDIALENLEVIAPNGFTLAQLLGNSYLNLTANNYAKINGNIRSRLPSLIITYNDFQALMSVKSKLDIDDRDIFDAAIKNSEVFIQDGELVANLLSHSCCKQEHVSKIWAYAQPRLASLLTNFNSYARLLQCHQLTKKQRDEVKTYFFNFHVLCRIMRSHDDFIRLFQCQELSEEDALLILEIIPDYFAKIHDKATKLGNLLNFITSEKIQAAIFKIIFSPGKTIVYTVHDFLGLIKIEHLTPHLKTQLWNEFWVNMPTKICTLFQLADLFNCEYLSSEQRDAIWEAALPKLEKLVQEANEDCYAVVAGTQNFTRDQRNRIKALWDEFQLTSALGHFNIRQRPRGAESSIIIKAMSTLDAQSTLLLIIRTLWKKDRNENINPWYLCCSKNEAETCYRAIQKVLGDFTKSCDDRARCVFNLMVAFIRLPDSANQPFALALQDHFGFDTLTMLNEASRTNPLNNLQQFRYVQ